MEQLEQGISTLVELIDHYGQEMRAISKEALGGGRKGKELRGKVAEVQDRIHREAWENYERLVTASAEIERELMAKLTQIKETTERAALLREVISLTVKPGVSH